MILSPELLHHTGPFGTHLYPVHILWSLFNLAKLYLPTVLTDKVAFLNCWLTQFHFLNKSASYKTFNCDKLNIADSFKNLNLVSGNSMCSCIAPVSRKQGVRQAVRQAICTATRANKHPQRDTQVGRLAPFHCLKKKPSGIGLVMEKSVGRKQSIWKRPWWKRLHQIQHVL